MTLPLVGAGKSAAGGATLAGLSNLFAWFQDDGPFYQDSGRSAFATANGDPVASWTDKSGNGRHLAQGVNKPVLATGAINSLTAVSFVSGANRYMGMGGSPTPTLPITVYVVYLLSGTPAGLVMPWEATDVNEEAYYYYLRHNASLTPELYEDYTPATITAGSALVANTAAIVTAIFNGATSKIRVNGGAYVTGALEPKDLYVPGVQNVGAAAVGMKLASLVMFAGGAVSAGDDTTVLNYLNTRYAIY